MASDLKNHPFFSSIDWSTVWTLNAPPISTGLTKPVATLASADAQADLWAVFDDEVSDGGFDVDDNEQVDRTTPPTAHLQREPSNSHRWSPHYDHYAAAEAVRAVDLTDSPSADLDPPRPGWMDSVRKKRGFSRGSARTSSSSSANRTALTGLLETMGIPNLAHGSGRTSRTSMKSDEPKPTLGSMLGDGPRSGNAVPSLRDLDARM